MRFGYQMVMEFVKQKYQGQGDGRGFGLVSLFLRNFQEKSQSKRKVPILSDYRFKSLAG